MHCPHAHNGAWEPSPPRVGAERRPAAHGQGVGVVHTARRIRYTVRFGAGGAAMDRNGEWDGPTCRSRATTMTTRITNRV